MASNQEPTPGAPGGSSGPRSATAATFVVNDASLRSLHSTFEMLIKDVGRFNSSLIALEKGNQTLESVRQKLAALGIGGMATVGSGGNQPLSAGTFTRVGDSHAPNGNGGDARTSAQVGGVVPIPEQGGQGQGQAPTLVGRALSVARNPFVAAGITGAYAVGGFYKRSMGDMSDLDLMFAQQASTMGPYNRTRYNQARGFLTGTGGRGIGGYQSAQDLLTGVGNIQGALGGGLGDARTRGALRNAGQLAALNPAAGLAGSTAAVASLYAPSTAIAAQSMGISTIGAGGRANSPQSVYQQIQRLVFHGQKITPNMIAVGMQPGAPLFITLSALGLDANAMEQFRYYALAQANLGGSAQRTQAALDYANTGKGSTQAKNDATTAGLRDTIRAHQNLLGGAQTRRTAEAGAEGKDTLETGFTVLARVTDDLTGTFRELNKVTLGGSGHLLPGASFLPGSAGGVKGLLSGGTQSLFGYELYKSLPKFAGRVASKGGIAGRLASGLGGDAAQHALGMSGAMGTPVYVTNMPGGGGGFGTGTGWPGSGGVTRAAERDAEKAAEKGVLGKLLDKVGLGALGSRLGGAVGGITSGLNGGAEAVTLGAAGTAGVFAGAAALSGIAGKGVSNISHDFTGGLSGFNPLNLAKSAFGIGHGPVVGTGLNDKVKHYYESDFYAKASPTVKAILDAHRSAIGAGLAATQHQSMWDKMTGNVHTGKLSKAMADLERDLASGKAPASTSPTAPPRFYGFEAGNAPGMSIGIGQPGGAVSPGDSGGSNVAPSTKPAAANSTISGIISTAESFVGRPYKWGGSNPKTSFDCSGLTQWSYGQHGIKLPRRAEQQQGVGTDVPLDQLVPGDLVFYGSPAHHVAMYLGNGMMVEAPQTGEKIRNTKLRPPTNARRMVGGGAGVKGSYAMSAGGSAVQGDSGLGPQQAPSSNLSTSVFGDELSALANVLTPPSLAAASAVTGVTSSGASASGTTSPYAVSSGKAAGGSTASAAPTSVSGNQALAKTMAGRRGWTGKEWNALYALWNQESGFGTTAGSPQHAYGIPQALPGSKMASAGADWLTNPATQITWGLGYIQHRYHDPIAAWAHKAATDSRKGSHDRNAQPGGWYDAGAWQIGRDETARVHKDEMIVPAAEARRLRASLARRGQQMQSAGAAMASTSGGHQTIVHLTAPIQVVGKATAQDARDFLHMVKAEMEKSHDLDFVGSG